jgi:hypothetical protein
LIVVFVSVIGNFGRYFIFSGVLLSDTVCIVLLSFSFHEISHAVVHEFGFLSVIFATFINFGFESTLRIDLKMFSLFF